MSLRHRLSLLAVSAITALSLAAAALAHDSTWTLSVDGSTYGGNNSGCQLNDSNTPKVCVGTLVSGPGVTSGTRIVGVCNVTFGGPKAIMVCPPSKQ